ncbi:ABC transporter permease [Cellulomonas xiejunii]|uniref:ABC transporter permease n=1 Tax=Cellulomonas xiejunii TaxID=2968083 RepID=A0ABY5KUU6_9CELL|nr:ABC transporter permease [Cellulomonas xiejunii]MCC2314741.1 ABC transporter permease [Cellulomonas xiejunii]MCC2323003.1 ABC transporter permease [Cellulomonas xiejunii]UUI73500.1 ABC transporter permease [Cellulomonas xiejunii]
MAGRLVTSTRTATTGGRRRVHEVRRLVVRRATWAVPLVLGVSALVFLLASRTPSDSTTGFLGARTQFVDARTREAVARMLDQGAWWEAWASWWRGAAGGDWGTSTVLRGSVSDAIAGRVPWTLLVMTVGLVLAFMIAVPLALAAAARGTGAAARLLTACAWVLSAAPAYIVGLGLLLVFSVALGWFPAGGLGPPGETVGPATVARHAALPCLAVALSQVPWIALHLHAGLVGARASDAVLSARMRGLPPRTVTRGHVLPVAVVPLLALMGARLPELVVGAVLVETVFSWPGLGQALVDAAVGRDLALLAGTTVCLTVMVLAGNLLADAALVAADPRVVADEL